MSTIESTPIQTSAEVMTQPEIPLPPLADGYVRLYRGDIVDEDRHPIVRDVTGRATAMETAGRWFTDNPNDAEGYAGGRQADNEGSLRRYTFVDVPAEIAATYNTPALSSEQMRSANGGHTFANEWLLPRELADGATEYNVVQSEEMYDPTVIEDLHSVVSRPEVQSALQEMGVDNVRLEDIQQKPIELQQVLEQLSMMLGQNHLSVADRDVLSNQLAGLNRGVQSAHKQRVLGSASAKTEASNEITQPKSPSNNTTQTW